MPIKIPDDLEMITRVEEIEREVRDLSANLSATIDLLCVITSKITSIEKKLTINEM